MTRTVIFLRPFVSQQCLSLGITALLFEVGLDRIPAVVPDDCRWSKTERPSTFLQAPAYVYVISRNPKKRVETSDRHQSITTVRHVATWNVLGELIRR